MSSGDDDYGNPQRKIDDQQILLNMRDERIALLRTKLQAAQERADRWKDEAMAARARGGHSGGILNRWPLCPEAAAGPCDCDICKLGFALAESRAINDTAEPPQPTEREEGPR